LAMKEWRRKVDKVFTIKEGNIVTYTLAIYGSRKECEKKVD